MMMIDAGGGTPGRQAPARGSKGRTISRSSSGRGLEAPAVERVAAQRRHRGGAAD
jgi:hypothetical protein